MDKIGFIGLGSMGGPMAARLARAGLAPRIYDVREEPLRQVAELGGVVCSSVDAVARGCSVIQVIVVDETQVRDVMLGKGTAPGLLASCETGAVIAVHSTIRPGAVIEMAARASERGVNVIDAPVSGAAMGAVDGTLSMMVGCDPSHLEQCRAVFEHQAAHIFHMGDVGMGLVAKLVNNLVGLVNGRALAEGLKLAKGAGLESTRMLEVLNASTGRSWASEEYEAMREAARGHPQGRDGLAQIVKKDMALAVALGRELGVSLPLGETVALR